MEKEQSVNPFINNFAIATCVDIVDTAFTKKRTSPGNYICLTLRV